MTAMKKIAWGSGLMLGLGILQACERAPATTQGDTKAPAGVSAGSASAANTGGAEANKPPAANTAAPSVTADAITPGAASTQPSPPPQLGHLKIPGVPKKDLSTYEEIKAAKKLETTGSKLNDSAEYQRAIEPLLSALSADPRNLHARYELARALSNLDKLTLAVAALESMTSHGRLLTQERLIAASKSKDFRALHKLPAFVELVAGAEKGLMTVEKAATQMANYFYRTSQGKAGAHSLLDPRALVVVRWQFGSIGSLAPPTWAQLHGEKAFRKHVEKEFTKGIYPEVMGNCTGSCCEFTSPVPAVHLTKMCFKTVNNKAVHLFKIELHGDPANSFPG